MLEFKQVLKKKKNNDRFSNLEDVMVDLTGTLDDRQFTIEEFSYEGGAMSTWTEPGYGSEIEFTKAVWDDTQELLTDDELELADEFCNEDVLSQYESYREDQKREAEPMDEDMWDDVFRAGLG